MTPFAKGKDILQFLEGLAATEPGYTLPPSRYVTLSEPVVDCERVIVALSSISPMAEIDPSCGPVQIGNFIVAISRSCANIADQNGETIPSEAEAIGAIQSQDGDFLWKVATTYPAFGEKDWDLGFTITGGIAITSLTLMTGID